RHDHKIQFVYQINEVLTLEMLRQAAEAKGVDITEEMMKRVDKRFIIRSAPFNFKLSFPTAKKQSALTVFLSTILGRPLAKEELEEGFDLEGLIGLNLMLAVQHKPGDEAGAVFANVVSATPWTTKYGSLIEVEDYVRVKDRKEEKNEAK